jgi:hypothetical protein
MFYEKEFDEFVGPFKTYNDVIRYLEERYPWYKSTKKDELGIENFFSIIELTKPEELFTDAWVRARASRLELRSSSMPGLLV